MAWTVEFERSAERELTKLGPKACVRIVRLLYERVAKSDNPRSFGQALKGARLGEPCKYRVGEYRVIPSIEDKMFRVVVVRVAHGRDVYR